MSSSETGRAEKARWRSLSITVRRYPKLWKADENICKRMIIDPLSTDVTCMSLLLKFPIVSWNSFLSDMLLHLNCNIIGVKPSTTKCTLMNINIVEIVLTAWLFSLIWILYSTKKCSGQFVYCNFIYLYHKWMFDIQHITHNRYCHCLSLFSKLVNTSDAQYKQNTNIQDKYVVVPPDKATNNIVLILIHEYVKRITSSVL